MDGLGWGRRTAFAYVRARERRRARLDDQGSHLGWAKVKRATERAFLVELREAKTEIWIPKSVIHDDSEVFDARDNAEGELVVMAWWARKEEL